MHFLARRPCVNSQITVHISVFFLSIWNKNLSTVCNAVVDPLRSIAFWVWRYWHSIGPCSDYTLILLCWNFRITEEFQAARLFLSHYGFLSLEALKVGSKFITTTTQGIFYLCIGESFEWPCALLYTGADKHQSPSLPGYLGYHKSWSD